MTLKLLSLVCGTFPLILRSSCSSGSFFRLFCLLRRLSLPCSLGFSRGLLLAGAALGAEAGVPVLLGPGLGPAGPPDHLGDLLHRPLGHGLGPGQLGGLGEPCQPLPRLALLPRAPAEGARLLQLGGGLGRGLGLGGLGGGRLAGLLRSSPQQLGKGSGEGL